MSTSPTPPPNASTDEPCPDCGAAPCTCPQLDAEEAAEQAQEQANRAAIEEALALLPHSPEAARDVLREAFERAKADMGRE